MSNIDFVDEHQAKIRSITMEAPEGYEFGHVVKAEVEMRVGKLEYSTDKEGNMIRTAVLVVEGCHIKSSFDPAQAYADAGTGADADAGTGTDVQPDTTDDIVSDVPDDPEQSDDDRQPVGAGVGAVDPDVGF